MKLFGAVLRSMRPMMLALVSGLIVVSTVLAIGRLRPSPTLLMCLSACLIVGGQFLFNDVMDVEIDRRKPHPPPVATGAIAPAIALVVAAALVFTGLGVAALVARWFALWWLGIALILTAYSRWITFKNGALANLVVAGCVTLALFSPLTVLPNPLPVLAAAPMTFFATLTREIALDLEDAQVDHGVRARCLHALFGPAKALWIALATFALQIAASYLPPLLGTAGSAYAWSISALNLILLGAVLWRGRAPTPLQRIGKASILGYMTVILAAA